MDRSTDGQILAEFAWLPSRAREQAVSDWATRALHFTPSKLQAEILNYQGDRLILCCARQWGKSTIIAIKALHEAVHNPNTVTIILSRSKPQASVILQRIRANAAALGLAAKRYQGRDHSIALPNGSAIFAIAHNAETAVGYTANTLIVDEAAIVNDETFAAVLPCIARTNGKLWMLSTPNGQTGNFLHHLARPKAQPLAPRQSHSRRRRLRQQRNHRPSTTPVPCQSQTGLLLRIRPARRQTRLRRAIQKLRRSHADQPPPAGPKAQRLITRSLPV